MATGDVMAATPLHELKALLEGRMLELARELAPEGERIEGHRRWSLNPTRADQANGSFVIDIRGAKAGRWWEFAGGFGGDVIDLISYCRFAHGGGGYQSADNRGKAIRWAKAFLGWDDQDDTMLAHAKAAAAKARAQAPADDRRDQGERARKARRARAWWFQQPKMIEGSVAARYLEEARGIPLAGLADRPRALRPVRELTDKESGTAWPGMLSAMSGLGTGIRAVHMTFLDPSGRAKADVPSNKKMFGDVRGAAIRLAKGENTCSPEEAMRLGLCGEILALAEGIEDGLSWALMEPAHRVWAAGALGFIGQVEIPASVEEIRVLAQNDPAGSAAADAFERQARALTARYPGKRVIVERPRDGLKDWNDIWRAAA